MKNFIPLFMACLLVSFSVQATQLRLNLKKGQEYRQSSNTKMIMVQEMMGQKMNIDISSSSTMVYTVKEVNESDYHLEVSYDNMKMSLRELEQIVAMGLDIEAMNEMFGNVLKSIEGKSFDMTLTRTGTVKEVHKLDELWKDVIDNLTDVPAAQKAQIMTQLTQAYGSDAVKQNLEMMTAIYPEQSVETGDTWTNESEINVGMFVNISTDYTLEKLTNDEVFIKGKSLIDADLVNEEMKKMTGMDLKSHMKGTIQSDYKLDRKTGWIIGANMIQKVTSTTSMPQGMDIKMEISSETTITN